MLQQLAFKRGRLTCRLLNIQHCHIQQTMAQVSERSRCRHLGSNFGNLGIMRVATRFPGGLKLATITRR